jgi:hypothetical protein
MDAEKEVNLHHMESEKIDLGNCSLQCDDEGVVELHIYPDQVVDIPKVREIFDTIHTKIPQATTLMVTAGNKATLSPEARELVSKGSVTEQIKADAIVTEHYSHQMSANFFVRYNQPQRPTKLFKTEKEARAWLKQFS